MLTLSNMLFTLKYGLISFQIFPIHHLFSGEMVTLCQISHMYMTCNLEHGCMTTSPRSRFPPMGKWPPCKYSYYMPLLSCIAALL